MLIVLRNWVTAIAVLVRRRVLDALRSEIVVDVGVKSRRIRVAFTGLIYRLEGN